MLEGLNHVLESRVHRVGNEDYDAEIKSQSRYINVSMECAEDVNENNPLEEKIKVYDNTDYGFQVDESGDIMVIDAREPQAFGDLSSEDRTKNPQASGDASF